MDSFAVQRNQANLRSIVRSDPAVQEILETSVYSTIYHYTAPEVGEEGGWVKQKAEGPTFIIRRNTTPEYALYVLNRQTVKNVTIPLVKGEMKAIAVGEGMLQVARRGEKLRRGIWFSEPDMVEKFQVEITRICGPPSQRNQAGGPAADSPVMIQPIPQVAGGSGVASDGFSRLFAGLMTTPSAGSTPPSQPAQPGPAVTQHQVQTISTVTTAAVPLPFSSPPPAAVPYQTTNNGSPPPVPHSTHPPPPPQNPFTPPPGQTVDDLLNSILGVTSFPPLGQPTITQRVPPLSDDQLPPAEKAPHIPLESKPEALHLQEQQFGKQGDTIQNNGDGPLSMPSTSSRPALATVPGNPRPPVMYPNESFGQSDMLIAPSPDALLTNRQPISPAYSPSFPIPPAPLPDSLSALKGSLIDALGGVADLRPAGRAGFAQVLEGLIRNEPRFVDDLWEGYLRRMAGG